MNTQIISALSLQAKNGIFSTHLAIGTFLIGSLIMLLHQSFPSTEIFILAVIFSFFAAIVNTIVLLTLLYHWINEPDYREYFAVKILILLSNIPIAAFYIFISFI